MRLKNKVALITGGAHRVGKAVTLMLAHSGCHVIINYYSSAEEADETEREAHSLGVDALSIRCDVADLDAVRAMVAQIEENFGGVDIIVNGASLFGQFKVPTTNDEDLEKWLRITGISINGAFYVSNLLAPGMIRRAKATAESGAIVSILDLSIWQPWARFTAHAVGKAGLLALTRQLALELAPHVRVNAIAPGLILPPQNSSEERNRQIAERNLLKRWGDPEDAARAVKFLVESDFITGDVIKVDGGEEIAGR